jgi:hypothetical protein
MMTISFSPHVVVQAGHAGVARLGQVGEPLRRAPAPLAPSDARILLRVEVRS